MDFFNHTKLSKEKPVLTEVDVRSYSDWYKQEINIVDG